jgi:lipopolysaccharide transport system ATP-binding protein
MSNLAIRVEGISKSYRLQTAGPSYGTLRDALAGTATSWAKRLTGKQDSTALGRSQTLWALQDVSFDIAQGEVVGIIGRNGAGKSTLLKILSRITKPTRGRASTSGRVGCLLEVGTGFHPELSGRENIYMNAAILGMSRQELTRLFDQIVDFADIHKHLDTPIKYYSSGMQMRLAFSVAAHLRPEIMIVDEVLAVGDAAFQKKCLSRMSDVAEEGRTILFVSHQLNQIRRLCTRCVWLDQGRVRQIGPTADVVAAYEAGIMEQSSSTGAEARTKAHYTGWEIVEPNHGTPHAIQDAGPCTIRFHFQVNSPIHHGTVGASLMSDAGQPLWTNAIQVPKLLPGKYTVEYRLEMLPLRPGAYYWLCAIFDQYQRVELWESMPRLSVLTQPYNNSDDQWAGIINMPFTASLEQHSGEREPELASQEK